MLPKNQRNTRCTGTKKINVKIVEAAWWLIICSLWNVILAGIWRTSTKVLYPFGRIVKEQERNKRKNCSVYNSVCSLAMPQDDSSFERHRISNFNTTVALGEKSRVPWTSESTLQHSVIHLPVNSIDNTRSSQASWAALMTLSALRNDTRHLLQCENRHYSSKHLLLESLLNIWTNPTVNISSWCLTCIVNQLR